MALAFKQSALRQPALPQPAPPQGALSQQAPRQAALHQPVLERLRRQLLATRPRELERPGGAAPSQTPARRWDGSALAGRLVELSAAGGAGALTWALRLVAEVQAAGGLAAGTPSAAAHGAARPVAWVQTAAGGFYPPDAAATGVALEALAVVRVPDAAAVARAAERLARSGGFALVVLDLVAAAPARSPRALLPPALQGRLVQHALRHGTAVLCLTEKPERAASLGALVSLRVLAGRRRAAAPQDSESAEEDGAAALLRTSSLRQGPQAPAPTPIGVKGACSLAGESEGAAPPRNPKSGRGAVLGREGDRGDGDRPAPGHFTCALHAAKDKRGGPGWGEELACHGPPGLR
jgi:hypothetical protein